MLFTFRQSNNAEGCFMWGKVLPPRSGPSNSPLYIRQCQNGSETTTFRMNFHSEKVDGAWQFEQATVGVHAELNDTGAMKLTALARNLRPSDPVLVIGRHSSKTIKRPRSGKTETSHYVEAFAIIPVAWLCDIFSELFEEIVETSAAPSSKTLRFSKSKITPEVTEESEEAPPEAENDMKGWFD